MGLWVAPLVDNGMLGRGGDTAVKVIVEEGIVFLPLVSFFPVLRFPFLGLHPRTLSHGLPLYK